MADALASAREQLAVATRRLGAADARTEALADYVPTHTKRLIPRPARLVGHGRVWRLGVLLLSPDATLHALGEVIRVTAPGHPQHVSNLAEQRKAVRALALRSGYAIGDTVNFAAQEIPLDADAFHVSGGPVVLVGDDLRVRWSASADTLTPFADYLSERVDLLIHPPEGA